MQLRKKKLNNENKVFRNTNLSEVNNNNNQIVNNQISESQSVRRHIQFSNNKEPIAVNFRSVDGNINYPIAGFIYSYL